MEADNIAYFSKISVLMEELNGQEREVLKLALSLDGQIKDPEKLRKINENLFRLWEIVVKYNKTMVELEILEAERYEKLK